MSNENKCQISALVTQMKTHLKRKQFELLRNALGVMAVGLADVEDSFNQENSAVHMRGCNQARFGSPVSLYR